MKYHVSDSGEVVRCRAREGNCPKDNFDTIEEAEQYRENTFSKNISTIPVKRASSLAKTEEYYGGKFITPYTMDISQNVEKVLDDLYEIGNPLIVGGAVRDSFIGSENKDIDIEVHHTDIDNLSKSLKKKGYTVDEVGKQFGVLKVAKKGVIRDLDVSVPRQENRLGAGHRSFQISMDKDMTVQEAAERRDFTFNAVMYDHKRHVLVDPTGGQEDFKNKTMKHVSEKFAEDPLRVLRGFQFAARFGLTMDKSTIEMSRKLREEYKHLSVERVQEEWGKFFTKSVEPLKGTKVLRETGWDDTEQGLKEALDDKRVLVALNNLPHVRKENKITFGAAVISENMSAEEKKRFITTAVIGSKQQKLAETYSTFDNNTAQTTYERKMLAKELSKYGFTFKDYKEYSTMKNDVEGVRLASLAISEGIGDKPEQDLLMGKDLMNMTDKKPGPWMGELLDKVREEQYRGWFNNKDEALSYARSRMGE